MENSTFVIAERLSCRTDTWVELPGSRRKPQNRSWRYGNLDALLAQFLWLTTFGLGKPTEHIGLLTTDVYHIVLDAKLFTPDVEETCVSIFRPEAG
jgi:hypothetical protein